MDIKPFAVVSTNLYDVHGRWGTGVVSALHGADDYVAGAELMGLSASRLRIQEKRAVESADIVTAISPLLADRWAELRGTPVPLIPNGCTPLEPGTSAPPLDHRDLPRPLVGLVGRLNKRIDMDLLEAIVDEGTRFSSSVPMNHSGNRSVPSTGLAAEGALCRDEFLKNEAPAYIAATDIGITPYLDSQFNRASFPLKTLDYLSAGRPTVSTDLPAARWLLDDLTRSEPQVAPERILALADNQDAFIRALRKMVGEPGQPADAGSGRRGAESARAEACQAFAARHTWSRRADALAVAIGLTPEPDRSAAQRRAGLRTCQQPSLYRPSHFIFGHFSGTLLVAVGFQPCRMRYRKNVHLVCPSDRYCSAPSSANSNCAVLLKRSKPTRCCAT